MALGLPKMPKGHYQCDQCATIFSFHPDLLRHQEHHKLAEDPNAQFKCDKCNLAFKMFQSYKTHLYKFHSFDLPCSDCDQKFTMPHALKTHIANYHTKFPSKCDDCDRICTDLADYKKHVAAEHEEEYQKSKKIYTCEICGKELKSSKGLQTHMTNNHGKKETYSCDRCGKIFQAKNTMIAHSKVHTGEYPHKCSICGKGFLRLDRKIACENIHAGIYLHHCVQCDFKTNMIGDLKKHQDRHSSYKPFSCPVCLNYSSSNEQNLFSHLRKMHKTTLSEAVLMTKRNKFGQQATETELESARQRLERTIHDRSNS